MNPALLHARSPLRRAAAFAAIALPLLTSCGGGTFFQDSTDGQIRLVNASTDSANGIDLLESTNGLIGGTAQYTASDYVSLAKGDYTFNLRTTGTSTTAYSLSGSIGRGNHYAMVAYTSGGGLAATQVSEDEGEPGSGRAKFRVLNTAGSDTGAVDVYLINDACTTLTNTNIAAFATKISDATSAYTEVLTGTYHVCVVGTGDKTDVRLDVPNFTLADKNIRSLIVARTPGGVLLNGLILDQQGALTPALSSSARLRVAVSTTGDATVDANINGTTVAAAQPSKSVSGYVTVPSGALTATLSVGGVAVTPSLSGSIAAGADLTLLVTDAGTATLITDDNTASTSTTNPVKIRLVNGVNNSNPIAMSVNSTLAASGVGFKSASASKQIAVSAGTATIAVTGTTTPPPNLTAQTFETGNAYVVFVLGDTSAPVSVLAAAR